MKIKFVIKGDIPTVDYLDIKNNSPIKRDSQQYKIYIKQLNEILAILNYASPKENTKWKEQIICFIPQYSIAGGFFYTKI